MTFELMPDGSAFDSKPLSDQEIRARALEGTIRYLGRTGDVLPNFDSPAFKDCLDQFEAYIRDGR